MTHTSTEQPEALPTPEAVMDQAQVFASAWALYGSGRILEPEDSAELAAEEKEKLAVMVLRLHARVVELEAQTAHMADLVELADYATKKLEASQAQRVPLSKPITHAAHRPTWDGQTWAMTPIKPMHDIKIEQLHAHWEQHKEFGDVPFTAGVRYAERAHGITQEKQG